MKFFEIKRLFWALRKLNVPISTEGLVLDVGSGGRPYPRSDVLLDRLTGSEHRCGEEMMLDSRDAVFGDAAKMPFKDKSFDFIIASHILEHMSDPEQFINELMRVGKAGYIETPNAIFERLYPHAFHCLEIFNQNGRLVIRKKTKPLDDEFLSGSYILKNDPEWSRFFNENPKMFHVRYYWDSKILFEIQNPEIDCSWVELINNVSEKGSVTSSYMRNNKGWREIGQTMLKLWYQWRRKVRLKGFKLVDILQCPECAGELVEQGSALSCKNCHVKFAIDPIPNFCNPIKSC